MIKLSKMGEAIRAIKMVWKIEGLVALYTTPEYCADEYT